MKTRRGIAFRVREAVVMVAESGGESLSILVERVQDGQTAELFLGWHVREFNAGFDAQTGDQNLASIGRE